MVPNRGQYQARNEAMSSFSAWPSIASEGTIDPQPSSSNNATKAESMQRTSSSDRPQPKKTQTRQLLSCTKCRERKVKCDRTKPCSACCARGHPRDCEFVIGEGNDFTAIQQSYEIRKLRQENQKLRERLHQAKLGHSGDEDEDDTRPGASSTATRRAALARQRRFRTSDRVDNLYFGTPGLASMVSDFANLQVGSQSLSHPMPRLAPQDVYAPAASMYPFPVMWQGESSPATLVQLLPPPDEMFGLLESFQRRAQSCCFPHTPEEVTKKEVERFMSDVDNNAERFPDMLALLFATLAAGLQMGQYDRNGGRWIDGEATTVSRKGDVFIAASMQALRLASFMSRPTLLAVQTLVMMSPYLTNSGRFLDAWTTFGLTIRVAHSIGLHRNPNKFLDPVPSLRECMVRQSIWWWMLHMDQQYSVALGRPLGISGYGDCPPPETLTTNQELRRLGEFVHHFTILGRQILASESMSVAKIDEFTDKLVGLWDTMPATLQFNESWLRQETPLPEWPLDVVSAYLYANVQSYLVLLNRQRVERTQSSVDVSPPGSFSYQSPSSRQPDQPTHAAPIRGRSLVINASVAIVKTFLYYHYRNPAVLINWNISQQAFNAAMILLLDAWEMDDQQHQWLVNQAFVVFSELEQKHVHRLAGLAVKRLSDGLVQLGNRNDERERQQHMAATAASRRQQEHDLAGPSLTLDTAAISDWAADTVMGTTGMFLLEDAGLQSSQPQSFQPLAWTIAGGSNFDAQAAAYSSKPPSPPPTAPSVHLAHIQVGTFPVMPVSAHGQGNPSYDNMPQGQPAPQGQRRRLSSRQAPYPHVQHQTQQQQRQSSVQYPPQQQQQQPQPHPPLVSPMHEAFQQTFTPINPAAPVVAPHMQPPGQMYHPPPHAHLPPRRDSHLGIQHPPQLQHDLQHRATSATQRSHSRQQRH